MTSLFQQSSEPPEEDLKSLGVQPRSTWAEPQVTVCQTGWIAEAASTPPVKPVRMPIVRALTAACVALAVYDLVLLALRV
jgi:hypothetical protein